MSPLPHIPPFEGDFVVKDILGGGDPYPVAASVNALFASVRANIPPPSVWPENLLPLEGPPRECASEASAPLVFSARTPFLVDPNASALEIRELFGGDVPPQDLAFQTSSERNPLFESLTNDREPFPRTELFRRESDLHPEDPVFETSSERNPLFESLTNDREPLGSSSRLQIKRRRSGKQRSSKSEESIPFHPRLAEFWEVQKIGQVKCKMCALPMVAVLSKMNDHLDEIHPEIAFPYICGRKDCEKKFSNLHSFLIHRCHDNSQKEKYCLFCSSFTISRDRDTFELVEHTRSAHLFPEQPPYRCLECATQFSRIKCLYSHIKRHSENRTMREPDPSLTAALAAVGLTSSGGRTRWTSSLLELLYNSRNGLPKTNPGFDLCDRKLIQAALHV